MNQQVHKYILELQERGPIAWAEGPHGWINENGQPVKLTDWQRAILTAWWNNRETCSTLGISNIKKSGKTFLNAVLLCWRWLALPGQHFAAGNDIDQAASRAFSEITDMVRRNAYLSAECKVYGKELIFEPTGSKLTALASDFSGNAGANHLTASSTEAWGIIHEAGIRSWEELTVPPGRFYGLPALRIADSYAGYEGESKIWHGLVDRGLQGKRIDKVWPIFQDGGLILFHGEGDWAREHCFRGTQAEAEAYYAEQQRSLRPNAFIRFHNNQRTSGESQFLPDGAWQSCYSADVKPLLHNDKRKVVLGCDASTSRDLTSCVGVNYNSQLSVSDVLFVRVWKPIKLAGIRLGKPTVDLDETIGATVENLHKAGQLAAVVCDPYQMHSLIVKWSKMGIKVIELAQNAGRVESDTGLYDAVIGHAIRHFGDPTLDEHMKQAVAIETPRGIRLTKEKSSLKIDAAVALSMAQYGALERGITSGRKAYSGPNPFFGDFTEAEWAEFQRSLKPHPPGVHFDDCRNRRLNPTYGCEACKQETTGMFGDDDIPFSPVSYEEVVLNHLQQRFPEQSEEEMRAERMANLLLSDVKKSISERNK